MAGVGFSIRELYRRDDLLGTLRSYGHSAVAACAPWLFTVLVLAGLTFLGSRYTSSENSTLFRLLIIYNFAFSLVFMAPIMLVATRILSDTIYKKSVEMAVTHLLVLLTVAYGAGLLVAAPFYLLIADISRSVAIAAIVNYMVISGVWVVSIFLTALKDYRTISISFLAGLTTAFVCCLGFASAYGTAGMLWGFTLGLVLLHASLIAKIFSEYPFVLRDPRSLWAEYRRYWVIGLGGVAYNIGIWIDNWIMWSAPERYKLAGSLVFYPDYDGAMFLAFLTVVPAFAIFTLLSETDFFETYHVFYQNIKEHAPLSRIQEGQRAISGTLRAGFRNIAILQGTVSAIAILLAPQIISICGVTSLQVSMFRIGVLGAFFHVLFLFSTIVLYYFDLRRTNLIIYLVFFLANGLFTIGALKLGFRFYGYGYFLACISVFVISSTVVIYAIQKLIYLSFVKGGTILK